MTQTKVVTSRRRSAPMFECEGCNDLPIEVGRPAARRHVAETGHTVTALIEESIRYTREVRA